MLAALQKLVRLGIDGDIRETEAKHHVLANIALSIAIVQNIPLMVEAATFENWAWFTYQLVVALSYAPVIVLRAKRRHYAATTLLATLTLSWATSAPFLFGTASATQSYVLLVGLGVLLVYPAQNTLTAVTFSVSAMLIFVAIAAAGEIRPWLQSEEPQTKMAFVNHCVLATFLFLLGYYERRVVKRAETALEAERERSERLLLNVLPEPIAERLKQDPGAIADYYKEATVLFADIAGFTPMSTKLTPTALVERLNDVFTRFDDIAEEHGLEKIKTIGDAYMVAGGVPGPSENHTAAVAQMALKMASAVQEIRGPDGNPLQMRIGFHTGPLVAGVIGKKKFAYDLWGDTVNTASRMESHGEPGKIHVSTAVYEKLKDEFDLEKRGTITVKGKGEMVTYFLRATQE